MRQNQAQIDANLEILAASTLRLREANDAIARRLGLLTLGPVRIEAVAQSSGSPAVIRQNGRDRIRFSNAKGPQEAEAAAVRTFGKLVGRELTKRRTVDELKQTIRFESVRECAGAFRVSFPESGQ